MVVLATTKAYHYQFDKSVYMNHHNVRALVSFGTKFEDSPNASNRGCNLKNFDKKRQKQTFKC